jgi:hypothetical protein
MVGVRRASRMERLGLGAPVERRSLVGTSGQVYLHRIQANPVNPLALAAVEPNERLTRRARGDVGHDAALLRAGRPEDHRAKMRGDLGEVARLVVGLPVGLEPCAQGGALPPVEVVEGSRAGEGGRLGALRGGGARAVPVRREGRARISDRSPCSGPGRCSRCPRRPPRRPTAPCRTDRRCGRTPPRRRPSRGRCRGASRRCSPGSRCPPRTTRSRRRRRGRAPLPPRRS